MDASGQRAVFRRRRHLQHDDVSDRQRLHQPGSGTGRRGWRYCLSYPAQPAQYHALGGERSHGRWQHADFDPELRTPAAGQRPGPRLRNADRARAVTALDSAVAAPAIATLAVANATDGSRELRLAGRLDAYSIAGVWWQARAEVQRMRDRRIVIDATAVDYCDGGGVAMLVDLLRQERPPTAPVVVRGLKREFQTLLDQFDPASLRAPAGAPPERLRSVEEIGRAALIVERDIVTQIAFIGETSSAIWYAIRNPHRVRWKDVWYTCEQVGVNALPIVALISFLLGLIIAFQSAVPMRQYGAELFVADLVGLSILRELGPLMTAILLAGRSGAAFAAEIGTMKVNEELNALTTMGLDPVRFLVVTRIIAALLTVPLLTLFADVIGIFGGAVTMVSFNIPILAYLREIDTLVDVKDLWAGLAKAPAFAILIAGIGCLRGLQTQSGASAVGISATRAVVSGIILLVVVDGIYAFIYYLLDI
ncbi:MAG: MlaE family lipid ABC transporter permease subunit [Betaproteobacteria bacterium]|nr:MAG: MlaE family lipid ABC transporter permease subunit [Betaproteobacteria bacterium]